MGLIINWRGSDELVDGSAKAPTDDGLETGRPEALDAAGREHLELREIAVNYSAEDPCLWLRKSDNTLAKFSPAGVGSPGPADYLPLAGGTMQGPIALGNGAKFLEANDGKDWLEIGFNHHWALTANGARVWSAGDSAFNVEQPLMLAADPTQPLEAATKQYVDAAGSAGATGPAGPAGPEGPMGTQGIGIRYVGTVATVADLPATATQGDLYTVSTPEPVHGFVWDDTTAGWVDAGPVQGPQGIEGPAGPAGADGKDGLPGKQGAQGVQGEVGPAGADGAVGPAGPAGADGKDGLPGKQGVQGEVGPAGPEGPAGADGAAGPEGPAGPAGADGAPGVDGKDGLPGKQGAAGPKGDTGAAGADGVDGAVGPAGPQGDQGIQGEKGIQGDQGIQGAPGLGITFKGKVATEAELPATATQGDLYVVATPEPAHGFVWDATTSAWVDSGPVQGPQGVAGPAGVAGPQGPAGIDGPAGPQGVAGVDGAKGDKGDTGDVGPAGPTLVATATVLGGVKVGAGLAVTVDGALSVSGGFLPLTGGTLTGTLTLPSGTVGLAINGTNYNMLGGSGGVAYRNGTTNIVNFAGAEIVTYVPLTTPGTGVGIRFGSGGPSFSKSGTSIASSAPITVAAAPAGATELANKAYVDSVAGTGGGTTYTLPPATATVLGGVKQGSGVTIAADGTLSSASAYTLPIATGTVLGGIKVGDGLTVTNDGTLSAAGGGVANPVAGSVAGLTLWVGTQAAYDAIATKDSKTLYHIQA